MGTPRNLVDTDNIISEYFAGKSVKQLATDHGCSRQVIYRVFRDANITPRNRSEAMYLRMSQTSPEERKRIASAANKAKRGLANTPEMLHKRALAHKRFIGIGEAQFAMILRLHNVPVVEQEPFLSYNLDIGCGNIAVEIHTQTASPLTSKFRKKLMDCLKAGKSMVYVWIDPRKFLISNKCYKNLVSIVQEASTNPPSRSKYWVIRGTGELYASGSFDSD